MIYLKLLSNSPEGRERLEKTKFQGQDITALSLPELGCVRTLLYGAIPGACAETVTYPFEVVRRQLQMQVHGARLITLATHIKIVKQGGILALYAGHLPSILQVQPSVAISYFVYVNGDSSQSRMKGSRSCIEASWCWSHGRACHVLRFVKPLHSDSF